MNDIQNRDRLILRIILFPVRHVVIPVARFIHLGVTLNGLDDGFWFGLCGLLFIKSMLWLMTYHAR